MSNNASLLSIIPFSNFTQWDVKQFFFTKVLSSYPVEKLGKHLVHQTEKIKLCDYPDTEFGILGVSNKIGMFDADLVLGKTVSQKYHIVKDNWLAYNPYRINVGSIGLKTVAQKGEYISPAYVVFSCKDTLMPEYMWLLLKTNTFNSLIRDSTTGTVRQTLHFEKLAGISAPIPSIPEQQRILDNYHKLVEQAEALEAEANSVEKSIQVYLDCELDIVCYMAPNLTGLSSVKYSRIDKWGIDFINKNTYEYGNKYPVKTIADVCKIGSGGTPSRNNPSYYKGEIPWVKTGEVLNNVIMDTEEKITQEAIENSSAKLYPANSLIVAMYGQGDTRGRTAKLGISATTNQACAVLHNIDEHSVLTDYLWFYLQGEYERIREKAYGNNQPNLTADIIKKYPLVIPPIPEQQKIVAEVIRLKDKANRKLLSAEAIRQQAYSDFEQSIFSN